MSGDRDGLAKDRTRRVLELARDLLADLDPDLVLERVLAAAQTLIGAEYAALGVLDEEGRHLQRFLTAGIDAETKQAIGALPTGQGVLGELITRPEPLRLRDIGAHPCSYGFPPGHPPMHTFLGVPVLIQGRPFGNLYLADKHGGQEFDESDEALLVLLGAFAGLAIDHARRYTEAETRRAELAETVEALDATIQIAHALGGETDLDAMLQLIAKRARALVSARVLIIEYFSGEELVVAATAGEAPPGWVGLRLALGDSVAGTALRSLRTQRLEDEPNQERFVRHGLGRHGLRARSGLVVPLVFRGRGYGAIVAVDPLTDQPAFRPQDQRLLEAFANSAATAVATAEAARTERRSQRIAAAEQERTRWARELHDETLQGLAALRLGLASATRLAAPDNPLAPVVRDATVQLQDEIAALRSLIADLRPAALDQLGTAAAIEALAERHRREGRTVSVHVDLRDDVRHTTEIETAVYRTVQEALTNAYKHGDAHSTVITVTDTGPTIAITIQDDGDGFNPNANTDGFGLLGMHERIALLDGDLAIESAPGNGTTITATFPARRRTAA